MAVDIFISDSIVIRRDIIITIIITITIAINIWKFTHNINSEDAISYERIVFSCFRRFHYFPKACIWESIVALSYSCFYFLFFLFFLY